MSRQGDHAASRAAAFVGEKFEDVGDWGCVRAEPIDIDIAAEMDALRIAVGKVDAIAAAAEEMFDNTIWRDADPLHLDRMAHLIGAVSESATLAVAAVDHLRTVVADRQPAGEGGDWDDSP